MRGKGAQHNMYAFVLLGHLYRKQCVPRFRPLVDLLEGLQQGSNLSGVAGVVGGQFYADR